MPVMIRPKDSPMTKIAEAVLKSKPISQKQPTGQVMRGFVDQIPQGYDRNRSR